MSDANGFSVESDGGRASFCLGGDNDGLRPDLDDVRKIIFDLDLFQILYFR